MIEVGDRRTVVPVTFSETGPDSRTRTQLRGTVVYVHPRGRYCVLEFETRGGKIRESFRLFGGEIAE